MSVGPHAPGHSPASAAFGAKVELGQGEAGLCLVVGREAIPAASIAAVQGRIVTVFPDGRRALAMLSWEGLKAVQRDAAVTVAGPVSIDPERFARFAALTGLDAAEEPPTTAPSRAQEV
jgi:hypothetical protein